MDGIVFYLTATASCPFVVPSTPAMPGAIFRLQMTAYGPSVVIAVRSAAYFRVRWAG